MRILIAEDSDVCRRQLAVLLTSWGYEPECVTNGEDALSALLRADAPQLAILDWSMPGVSGVQVCRQLRSSGSKHYTYVLLLTGHTDQNDLIQAFEAGVDDYLTKPLDDRELRARLRAGSRVVMLQDSLQHQACHDALTGIWNRAAIFDFLKRELARAGRDATTSVSVIMGDLDHFKSINDRFGHATGDSALKQTAERIRGIIRSCDGVGRYGGEEFLIVLPDCGLEDALKRAEDIRAAVGAAPIFGDTVPVPVTLSMGVAEARHSYELAVVLKLADEALYRAKSNGRNRVEAAALQFESLPRQLLIKASDSAIRSGEGTFG